MTTQKRNPYSDRRAVKLLLKSSALTALLQTSRTPKDYRDGFVMGYFLGKLHGKFEGKWHQIERQKRRAL